MERWVLVFVVAVILASGVTGLLYARGDAGAWGSVLVLGATALVVAWYAHETRRLARATEDMARSTFFLATKECGADLAVVGRDSWIGSIDGSSGARRGSAFQHNTIENGGNRVAFDVRVEIDATQASLHLGEILPGKKQNIGAGTVVRQGIIRVSYRDMLQDHGEEWRWNEDATRWELSN